MVTRADDAAQMTRIRVIWVNLLGQIGKVLCA